MCAVSRQPKCTPHASELDDELVTSLINPEQDSEGSFTLSFRASVWKKLVKRLMERPGRDREQCVSITLWNLDLLVSRTVAERNHNDHKPRRLGGPPPGSHWLPVSHFDWGLPPEWWWLSGSVRYRGQPKASWNCPWELSSPPWQRLFYPSCSLLVSYPNWTSPERFSWDCSLSHLPFPLCGLALSYSPILLCQPQSSFAPFTSLPCECLKSNPRGIRRARGIWGVRGQVVLRVWKGEKTSISSVYTLRNTLMFPLNILLYGGFVPNLQNRNKREVI